MPVPTQPNRQPTSRATAGFFLFFSGGILSTTGRNEAPFDTADDFLDGAAAPRAGGGPARHLRPAVRAGPQVPGPWAGPLLDAELRPAPAAHPDVPGVLAAEATRL